MVIGVIALDAYETGRLLPIDRNGRNYRYCRGSRPVATKSNGDQIGKEGYLMDDVKTNDLGVLSRNPRVDQTLRWRFVGGPISRFAKANM